VSRDVPANKLPDDQQSAIIHALARGASPRQVAAEVGCALSTVQSYQRDLAVEIAEARESLIRDNPTGELDGAIAETIKAIREHLSQAPSERCPKDATALARLLKELNHARQLRAGAPTARTERRSHHTEEVTVVEVEAAGSDPLRALRDRMN